MWHCNEIMTFQIICDVIYVQPRIRNWEPTVILYGSDSQLGCRGTLGCRDLVPGVPPVVTIPWSIYLLNQLGLPPNIFNTKEECREPKKVGKHCFTRSLTLLLMEVYAWELILLSMPLLYFDICFFGLEMGGLEMMMLIKGKII